MTQALSIRPAEVSDADALQDLYLHLSPDDPRCSDAFARDVILDIGRLQGSAILVGELEGQLVTSCTLIIIPNLTRGGRSYALIENVVTHAGFRGQGYGAAILNAASERAWSYNCYKIMLSTGSANRATLAFYERAGFEQSRTGFQKRNIPPRAE